MNNIKEIAEKHLNAKLKDLGVNIPNYKHIAINIMLNFGKEVCELQKQECFNNAETKFIPFTDNVEINETSILECKNVCDE